MNSPLTRPAWAPRPSRWVLIAPDTEWRLNSWRQRAHLLEGVRHHPSKAGEGPRVRAARVPRSPFPWPPKCLGCHSQKRATPPAGQGTGALTALHQPPRRPPWPEDPTPGARSPTACLRPGPQPGEGRPTGHSPQAGNLERAGGDSWGPGGQPRLPSPGLSLVCGQRVTVVAWDKPWYPRPSASPSPTHPISTKDGDWRSRSQGRPGVAAGKNLPIKAEPRCS